MPFNLFKVLHFSPALYSYVTKTLHKSMIVVINKIDLAPRALTVAWKHYLLTKFPELKIVLFSSNPSEAAYAKGGEFQQQRRGTQANVLYLYYLVMYFAWWLNQKCKCYVDVYHTFVANTCNIGKFNICRS